MALSLHFSVMFVLHTSFLVFRNGPILSPSPAPSKHLVSVLLGTFGMVCLCKYSWCYWVFAPWLCIFWSLCIHVYLRRICVCVYVHDHADSLCLECWWNPPPFNLSSFSVSYFYYLVVRMIVIKCFLLFLQFQVRPDTDIKAVTTTHSEFK